MVDAYRTGLNYEPENSADLAEKIDLLAGNPGLRAEMGRNARKLAEDKFDRNKTYRELIDLVYS